jgi:hypothetical protein
MSFIPNDPETGFDVARIMAPQVHTVDCCLVNNNITLKLKWKPETYVPQNPGLVSGQPGSQNKIDVEVTIEQFAERGCSTIAASACDALQTNTDFNFGVTTPPFSTTVTTIVAQRIQSCGECIIIPPPNPYATPDVENCDPCTFKKTFGPQTFTVYNENCSKGWEKAAMDQLETQINAMIEGIKLMNCDCDSTILPPFVDPATIACFPCEDLPGGIKWSDIPDAWYDQNVTFMPDPALFLMRSLIGSYTIRLGAGPITIYSKTFDLDDIIWGLDEVGKAWAGATGQTAPPPVKQIYPALDFCS